MKRNDQVRMLSALTNKKKDLTKINADIHHFVYFIIR